MAKLSPLPVPFLKFIGPAEMLGTIGAMVPWLTRIRTGVLIAPYREV